MIEHTCNWNPRIWRENEAKIWRDNNQEFSESNEDNIIPDSKNHKSSKYHIRVNTHTHSQSQSYTEAHPPGHNIFQWLKRKIRKKILQVVRKKNKTYRRTK